MFILVFIPWLVISLFTKEKISSILASIISISSELLIVLFLFSPLKVFNKISLSLSIKDFKANPYCFFSLSASSSEIFNTNAISFVILFPPSGIVLVYKYEEPSNTPISVLPAPISSIITLSCNSLLSKIRFLCANVVGTKPSTSIPAFLNIDDICLTYSLSANIIWAFKVKLELKLPTGSSVVFPVSKINLSGTISIETFPSGISISLTCIIAVCTSLNDIPEYLSLASFVILFCTIVVYLPGIVTYAEFTLNPDSSSILSNTFTKLFETSSSLIIFVFLITVHL